MVKAENRRLLETIVGLDSRLWLVDVDTYSKGGIDLLLAAGEAIRKAPEPSKATDTLVTKIMLGIYGNVPAFDTFFRNGLGLGCFNAKNLKRVAEFYGEHKDMIDHYANSIHTLDFHTGEESHRHYTKAKILDMVGVIEGRR